MSWNWRMINYNDTTHGWMTPLELATLYGCLWNGYWQKGNLPNPSLTGNKASPSTYTQPYMSNSYHCVLSSFLRVSLSTISLTLSSPHSFPLLLSLTNHTNVKTWMFGDKEVKNKKTISHKTVWFLVNFIKASADKWKFHWWRMRGS